MRIARWIAASFVMALVLATGCKPKVGGKCTAGQSFCAKEGALFCGDDGKLVAMGCHGPKGCVQQGKVAACDVSLAVAGEGCEDDGNIACSVDKQAELDCKEHSWVVGATCKGAKGCETKGDELFCDHTIAGKDDPCHRDGQIACLTDKSFILKCEGNVMRAINSCRGPKGCTFEEQPAQQRIEFSCDDSTAEADDPCESEGLHACSVDKKSIHICKDKKFVSHKACPGPAGCTFDAVKEKLNCDTGSGIFTGSGGSAKVSSAAGAAGGTGKASAKAAAASAKPAASATVAGSASAKPATSVAAAGSASAKPAASGSAAASAAPVASASGKPAASAKPAASGKVKAKKP